MLKRKLALAAKPRRNTLAVVVLLFTLALVPAGQATDGRDFAGFYEVSNVTDLGDAVRLTLTVRIFNYSDADLTGAEIILQDSIDLQSSLGSFAEGVSVQDRDHVTLSGEVTIPRTEYTRWECGGDPRLVIRYSSGSERAIEMANAPSEVR